MHSICVHTLFPHWHFMRYHGFVNRIASLSAYLYALSIRFVFQCCLPTMTYTLFYYDQSPFFLADVFFLPSSVRLPIMWHQLPQLVLIQDLFRYMHDLYGSDSV